MSIYANESDDNNFPATWLMIKRHTKTGLQYFCKTTKKNPYRYLGSGKHWLRHINKHGKKNVETTWCKLFVDKQELVEYAVAFSLKENIVESTDWANLKIENGLDGGGIPGSGKGVPKTKEHKKKCSDSLKGRTFDAQWKDNLSKNHANVTGINNPRARIWLVTSPTGSQTQVNGSMDQFCKENNLPASVMRTIGRTGEKPKSGRCVGWDVTLLT